MLDLQTDCNNMRYILGSDRSVGKTSAEGVPLTVDNKHLGEAGGLISSRSAVKNRTPRALMQTAFFLQPPTTLSTAELIGSGRPSATTEPFRKSLVLLHASLPCFSRDCLHTPVSTRTAILSAFNKLW